MIPEIGHFALVLALMMALSLSVVPLWGSFRGSYAAMRLAPTLANGRLADFVKDNPQVDLVGAVVDAKDVIIARVATVRSRERATE